MSHLAKTITIIWCTLCAALCIFFVYNIATAILLRPAPSLHIVDTCNAHSGTASIYSPPQSVILSEDFTPADLAAVAENSKKPSEILILSANNSATTFDSKGNHCLSDRLEDLTINQNVNENATVEKLRASLAQTFPEAQQLSININRNLSVNEANGIGQKLGQRFPNALVIAIVNMPQNDLFYLQNFRRDITLATLASGECDQTCDLETPDENIIRILLSLNATRGTQSFSKINTRDFSGVFERSTEAPQQFFSFHTAGDIMLDRDTRRLMERDGFDAPWRNLGDLFSYSDLTFANLEGTVNEQPSTYTFNPPFRFVFSPDSVKEVKKYFDAVSLANNHARDVGLQSEEETHRWLDEIDLPWFGAFASPEHVFSAEIRGQNVTLVGYHAFAPDVDTLTRTIKNAKTSGDFVITYPHWGTEYTHTPDQNEVYLAQRIINAGADIIIGGHPHVWQNIDIVDEHPVVYSLGNFIFDQKIPETYDALTVGGIVTKDSITLYLIPIITKGSAPTPMTNQQAQQLFSAISASSNATLADQIISGVITFPR